MSFEASWYIRRALLDMSHIGKLINLINKFTLAGDQKWNVKIFQKIGDGHVDANQLKDDPAGKELLLAADSQKEGGLTKAYYYRDMPTPAGPGVDRDVISFMIDPKFPGNDGPYVLLEFNCKIASQVAHNLFVELSQVFYTDFCWHIPEYWGSYGWVRTIMEAALQRDYEWGPLDSRCHPKEIALAKSLAAALPRIGFEYYPPNSKPPLLPQRLGWLNCWSAEVAEHLGFPDPQKDADLLPLCHQLPSGHWIVQLTEDPLDLTRPDHVEAIVRAYWRFDKIGRRSKPAAKKAKAKAAPVDADSLNTYRIHQSDESGNWWQSDYPPIQASSEEEALRIYFCKLSRSRMPRPHETLNRLCKAYDAVALEVGGLPRGEDVQARLAE
ncbi:hypothetical protein GmRootA79_04010 [Acidovorax sp. A79]|uniref:DUF5953 family protein n=1 Tax=Acidovorax sp. A79 TaxID=3056107 RepID=UPI0034E8D84C